MSLIDTKLQELLQFAKKFGLMEMVWQDGELKIAFRRGPDAAVPNFNSASAAPNMLAEAPEPELEPEVEEMVFVKSPMVGTFRRSLAKSSPPLVMVGNHIAPGDPLAVVECMKIPTDVVSYAGGEIKEILVEDGQVVEYGQPLFSIVPANGSSNGAV